MEDPGKTWGSPVSTKKSRYTTSNPEYGLCMIIIKLLVSPGVLLGPCCGHTGCSSRRQTTGRTLAWTSAAAQVAPHPHSWNLMIMFRTAVGSERCATDSIPRCRGAQGWGDAGHRLLLELGLLVEEHLSAGSGQPLLELGILHSSSRLFREKRPSGW